MLSRRPFFARETRTRPFKSRRTFNELNRAAVRILVSGVSPNSTPASPLTAQSARSPHRHQHTRSPRSYPEAPAALHSPLKPERGAIGAVIRPRFTLPALNPAQRHHFTRHHQLSTTTPHLSLIQTKDPAHFRTNHSQNSPDHTKTRTLRTQHVNLGLFSPAYQTRHLTPGPFCPRNPHSDPDDSATPADHRSPLLQQEQRRVTPKPERIDSTQPQRSDSPELYLIQDSPELYLIQAGEVSLRLDFTAKSRGDEQPTRFVSS